MKIYKSQNLEPPVKDCLGKGVATVYQRLLKFHSTLCQQPLESIHYNDSPLYFQMLPWILITLSSLPPLQAAQQLRLNHHYVRVPRHDFSFLKKIKISSIIHCASRLWSCVT